MQVEQWATVLVTEQIPREMLLNNLQHLFLASEQTKTWLSSSDKESAQKRSLNSC